MAASRRNAPLFQARPNVGAVSRQRPISAAKILALIAGPLAPLDRPKNL
jgi:hypothetical protein